MKRLCVLLAMSMLFPSGAVRADDGGPRMVQPGDFYVTSDGGGCTLGFLLEEIDAKGEPTGQEWALSAGHCFDRSGARAIWGRGTGPTVKVGNVEMGRAEYAHVDWQHGIDVAAIRVTLPTEQTDPAVCFWGGPTAMRETPVAQGEVLRLTGNGVRIRPREVKATGYDAEFVQYLGPRNTGDSGGPLIDADGNALGIVAVGGLDTRDLSNGGASKINDMIELVEGALGIQLRLQTAPVNGVAWPDDLPDHPCSVGPELVSID